METKKFEISTEKSRIDWIGRKVTGSHNGSISIKEGYFFVNDGKLAGGKIVIDTSTIKVLDIKDPETNAQFAGHLASDDFFSIEKFPTSTFEIISAKEQSNGRYHLEGKLTIKGITHLAEFDAEVQTTGDSLNLKGNLNVDRTDFEIRFRSGNFFKDLGDTLIHNDFELDITINAKVAVPELSKK